MNRRQIALVLFAVLAASPLVVAQSPAPSASSDGSVGAIPRSDPAIPTRSIRAADADARLCLEFPTNLQVIMCAEKYRPHKHKA
jgi:hypothetical protein